MCSVHQAPPASPNGLAAALSALAADGYAALSGVYLHTGQGGRQGTAIHREGFIRTCVISINACA
jgi:hypothetical protein